ncbi:LysR substrate-binding domain-containing protein [Pelagibaculum spongiae]|uniref:LysR family transcriptional regulator n=1 Tax=Pelagibaculum spongiae TaxID=2080658 RepID=A0A2V1GXV9_9GAMM|nr:LysR substrate-binding domain-containing protein [Pelagibaculum spongiae]PVZ70177.1 LysR family transcriptional regulator [Pelagibaculum spongiae]
MQRLPQLRGIQAFVYAAKHLSFKKAADELNVTPTAISHNIKSLEDDLGVRLFNRLTRSLSLTNEGEIFAPLVMDAFSKLHEAVGALSHSESNGPLMITTTKSFASSWLSERAYKFRELYPDYGLKIDASDSIKNLTSSNFDVSIRHGGGGYDGLHFAWVLNNYVVPVCSPKFIDTKGRISPSDLLNHSLIVYEWENFAEDDPCWEKWFALSQTKMDKAKLIETYSDEYICIQAALASRGVALCSVITASSYLNSGDLVIPTDPSLYLKDKSYYLVCEKGNADKEKMIAFQEWLLDEADQYRESRIGSLIDDIEEDN